MRLPTNRAPSHPGEILKELFLDDLGLSQSEFARRIGCATKKINEIINGRRGISAEFAIELADQRNSSVDFWMNAQAH